MHDDVIVLCRCMLVRLWRRPASPERHSTKKDLCNQNMSEKLSEDSEQKIGFQTPDTRRSFLSDSITSKYYTRNDYYFCQDNYYSLMFITATLAVIVLIKLSTLHNVQLLVYGSRV